MARFTGRMLTYTLLTITVAYTALLFAGFKNVRDKTFGRVGALYHAAFKGPEKTTMTRVEIQERTVVQAPPPRPAPTTIPGPFIFKPGQNRPIRHIEPPGPGEAARAAKPGPARTSATPDLQSPATEPVPHASDTPAVAKGKEQETAYQNLLAGHKGMAELVSQGGPSLKFKNWQVLRSEGEEHWIDVVFQNTADNSEVHYTWNVNNASKKISPISYHARQLAK